MNEDRFTVALAVAAIAFILFSLGMWIYADAVERADWQRYQEQRQGKRGGK